MVSSVSVALTEPKLVNRVTPEQRKGTFGRLVIQWHLQIGQEHPQGTLSVPQRAQHVRLRFHLGEFDPASGSGRGGQVPCRGEHGRSRGFKALWHRLELPASALGPGTGCSSQHAT